MQITVDTAKDGKEDIQKAIEMLTHFLNKQPKENKLTNFLGESTIIGIKNKLKQNSALQIDTTMKNIL